MKDVGITQHPLCPQQQVGSECGRRNDWRREDQRHKGGGGGEEKGRAGGSGSGGQAFSRQVISPVTMVISLITGGPRGLLPARWEGGGGVVRGGRAAKGTAAAQGSTLEI